MATVYNDPEQFDLEIAKVLEELELPDVLVVWRRKSDGALFFAHDQGGDLSDPFENYTSVENLIPLEAETYLDFELEAESFRGGIDDEIIDEAELWVKRALDLLWQSGA